MFINIMFVHLCALRYLGFYVCVIFDDDFHFQYSLPRKSSLHNYLFCATNGM